MICIPPCRCINRSPKKNNSCLTSQRLDQNGMSAMSTLVLWYVFSSAYFSAWAAWSYLLISSSDSTSPNHGIIPPNPSQWLYQRRPKAPDIEPTFNKRMLLFWAAGDQLGPQRPFTPLFMSVCCSPWLLDNSSDGFCWFITHSGDPFLSGITGIYGCVFTTCSLTTTIWTMGPINP